MAAVALAGIVAAADTATALAPANGTQLGTGFAARPNTPAKGAHEVAVMMVTRARAMPDNGHREESRMQADEHLEGRSDFL